MAPFDRSHTSSYSPSIVTMAISCTVCELFDVENRAELSLSFCKLCHVSKTML